MRGFLWGNGEVYGLYAFGNQVANQAGHRRFSGRQSYDVAVRRIGLIRRVGIQRGFDQTQRIQLLAQIFPGCANLQLRHPSAGAEGEPGPPSYFRQLFHFGKPPKIVQPVDGQAVALRVTGRQTERFAQADAVCYFGAANAS